MATDTPPSKALETLGEAPSGFQKWSSSTRRVVGFAVVVGAMLLSARLSGWITQALGTEQAWLNYFLTPLNLLIMYNLGAPIWYRLQAFATHEGFKLTEAGASSSSSTLDATLRSEEWAGMNQALSPNEQIARSVLIYRQVLILNLLEKFERAQRDKQFTIQVFSLAHLAHLIRVLHPESLGEQSKLGKVFAAEAIALYLSEMKDLNRSHLRQSVLEKASELDPQGHDPRVRQEYEKLLGEWLGQNS